MTNSIPGSEMTRVQLESAGGPVELSVHDGFEIVRTDWKRLAANCDAHVYATVGFVEPWAHRVGMALHLSPRIILAKRREEPLGIVPLGFGRRFGIPLLLPLADTHTNMNGGLFADGWDCDPRAVHNAILDLVPEAEGLTVANVPSTDGHPLISEPCPSVHDALGGDLHDGFDGHLSRVSGKRKLKKHRQSARRFERAGGWRVRRIDDPVEAVAALDEARLLFAKKFDREGIADPFAAGEVRAFMKEVLERSVSSDRPTMAIWTLEVAGEVLAIQAGGGAGDHFSLMFMVFKPSDFDAQGPGGFLLHEVIAAAGRDGYRSFDLGRGREPYKTSWCDRTIPLHDVQVARSVRAGLLFAAERRATSAKRRIRESDRLWSIAQALRRRIGTGG